MVKGGFPAGYFSVEQGYNFPLPNTSGAIPGVLREMCSNQDTSMRKSRNSVVSNAAVLLVIPLLAACVTNNPRPAVVEGRTPAADGVMTAVVGPGEAGRCSTTPCRVYYRTPDADAPVTIVANNQIVGNFPPNRFVSLGDFNDTVRISIQGRDTPTAFVNIPRGGS